MGCVFTVSWRAFYLAARSVLVSPSQLFWVRWVPRYGHKTRTSATRGTHRHDGCHDALRRFRRLPGFTNRAPQTRRAQGARGTDRADEADGRFRARGEAHRDCRRAHARRCRFQVRHVCDDDGLVIEGTPTDPTETGAELTRAPRDTADPARLNGRLDW